MLFGILFIMINMLGFESKDSGHILSLQCRADSLVNLERMAREKSSLDDNSVRIIVEERPGGQKGERALTLFLTIDKKRR